MNKQEKNEFILKKPLKFLFEWRNFPLHELVSYVLMYASIPMLAYGIKPYNFEIILIIIFSIISLYSGFFAALIWNDLTDKDIDKIVHPTRPTAYGKIGFWKFFGVALLFSALTFISAIMISIWCLGIVGLMALFVTFHDKYLKKKVKLPAYSEVFTPIQWLTVAIFGYIAIWSTSQPIGEYTIDIPYVGYISFNAYALQNMVLLILFTYFIDNAHDLPEGIHDVVGDKKLGVNTYATSFGVKNTAKISFIMFFISGILGVLLCVRTILSPIFLIPFICMWIYILYSSYKLIISDEVEMKKMSIIVGRKGFDFFLMSFNLIFLDVLFQLINYHYNII
jgi:4-hydroxybenzoate polyprenyltransferase